MQSYHNQSNSNSKNWPVVTREKPCRECGGATRCKRSPDGRAGYCHRHEKPWRDAAKPSDTARPGKPYRPPTKPAAPGPDWQAVAERLRAAMTDERIPALADATGIPAAAWAMLSPGWADADELRTMKANGAGWADDRPDGAFAFAEHSGVGPIAGLSLRAMDGRKGACAGAKRGLVFPADIHQRPGPVLIVEGASDVAACCALGLAAVGRPSNRAGAEDLAIMLDSMAVLVLGENDGKPDGSWPGRDGAKSVAGKLAGRWAEPVRWSLPPAGAKDIREWLKTKLAAGLNASDMDAMKAAGAELLAAMVATAKEAKPEKRSQADALVDMARQNYRLGMSEDGEAFAVAADGPAIAIMLRGSGSGLRASLAKQYRQTTGKTPSASALADAMTALEGMAADADREPLGLRVAEHDDGIVVDLGDATGRAVVVRSGGWAVGAVSPVLFRRTALTGALPEPEPAEPGELLAFRDLLNVDNESWPLIAGWMVAALMPGIPHPVLLFGGEMGTGKSTAAWLVLELIDPSPAPLRSEPRDAEQWAVAASGSWCVCIDNVSHISAWFSDSLCKAVSGDGIPRRKLYTDSEIAVLAFRRCIMLTSIDPGAMRGDLGDRLLLADLERIPEGGRRTEVDLRAAYKSARPKLLGAMLSVVARTLAALPGVVLTSMPRMADFARVLAALDTSCPELTGGRALELFVNQRKRIAEDVIESDSVAVAVVSLVDRCPGEWIGTAAQLLEALTPAGPMLRGWPRTARALAGHMRRIRPALATAGIYHTPPDATDKTRRHRIEKRIQPPIPPEPPETAFKTPLGGFNPGRSPGGTEPQPPLPPDYRPNEKADFDPENEDSGRLGGSGGTLRPISGGNGSPTDDRLFAPRMSAAAAAIAGMEVGSV